jgi:HEAT repeat protein
MSDAVAAVDSDNRELPLQSYLRDNLLASIRDGVSDPKAIPWLEVMLKSPNLENRLSAIGALARMSTTTAISLLVSSLSDQRQEVRYRATIALADIYGMPYLHPSVPEFQQNEEKYVKPLKTTMDTIENHSRPVE